MSNKEKMWAYLVHMGPWGGGGSNKMTGKMDWEDEMWDYIVEEAPKAGINTIVLDICAGIEFASHPEITLDGAWTRKRLRQELARCKEKGLTLIPKINFSATHDVWLGPYCRMISTPAYYQLCNDLIKEAYELFDHPEYIHLGMDEEDEDHAIRRKNGVVIYRKGKALWDDLRFLIDCVVDTGAKPWIWSCPLFADPEGYKANIDPDEVILSPWYYSAIKEEHWTPVNSRSAITEYYQQDRYKGMKIDYVEQDPFYVNFRNKALPLMKEGYKYVPCASTTEQCPYNTEEILEYFKEGAPDDQIVGYITTTWRPTLVQNKNDVVAAFKYLKEAKEKFYK